MKDQDKILYCLSHIKAAFKKRGLTYAQIAELLTISETSVKRQLNADDLPISQILSYCELSGLSFAELWQQAESNKATIQYFSTEQDEAFYRYPHLYAFFVALTEAQFSAAVVQTDHQLDDASMHLYLRKLESLSLIRVSTAGSVRPLLEPPIGFDAHSKVINEELARICDTIAEGLRQGDTMQDVFMLAKPLKLPEELRDKFYQRMAELYAEFARLSEQYFIQDDLPQTCAYFVDWPLAKSISKRLPNIRGFDQV